MLTRRELCRLVGPILGLALATKKLRGAAASRLHIDSLLGESDLALPAPLVRAYRADVVITLLGVPIFARKAVGSAFAVVREAIEGDQKIVALQFAGGSNPERSHGFRYDGSMEEAVFERRSSRQAAYFGFVTSASDENYEQARHRILSRSSSPRTFVAVEGVHNSGCARCEKSWITVPDQCSGGLRELSQRIRNGFAEADRIATELCTPDGSASPTFLYSVLAALRSDQIRWQSNYIHNAKEYRIEWERVPDPHVGAALAVSQLALHSDGVMRVTGRTSCLSTRRVSTFRMWLDNRSQLPLRIEFQPRSYLRVSLEHEPQGAQPNNRRKEET